MHSSTFEVHLDNFEMYLSNSEVRSSNFEVHLDNFGVYLINSEVHLGNSEVRSSNSEVHSSDFEAYSSDFEGYLGNNDLEIESLIYTPRRALFYNINILPMKKIYHLGSCSTCQRILNTLVPLDGVVLQDLKTEPITPEQLEEMVALSGSYAALFSKRARLYRQKGLQDKVLSEADYKNLILEHYTFLKRPVLLFEGHIFIGNSKKVVQAAREVLHP